MKIAKDITKLIGRTPMVKINQAVGPADAELLAKLEWFNIGGSIKDRMVFYILKQAKRQGKIKGKTILEATSGNTGIALSMLGAVYGYKVKIIMSAAENEERKKLIRAYGAELILTPAEQGEVGAVAFRDELLAKEPEKFFCFDQFNSQSNPLAHFQTTAKEILSQTGGQLDMIVMCLGTGGTAMGVATRIKKEKPALKIVGVVPGEGVVIAGLLPLAEIKKFEIFDQQFFDEIIEINETEKAALKETAKKFARTEGLLIGQSSAAAGYVALKKARELKQGKRICVIFPDSGLKYLSGDLYG
ncbi:MAG: PLP-dependent cysteine synthase family protein [Patescibacteria group bacterium]|nr:PLP-dependent cysteine synthase family protein [Patescibacteria group bacterium]